MLSNSAKRKLFLGIALAVGCLVALSFALDEEHGLLLRRSLFIGLCLFLVLSMVRWAQERSASPPKRRLFKGSAVDFGCLLTATVAVGADVYVGLLPKIFVLIGWSLFLLLTIVQWAQGSASASATPPSASSESASPASLPPSS